MGKRNRKPIRGTAGTLLAALSLMAAATCAIPAYAQQPDAPTPTPTPIPIPIPKTDTPPAVADCAANAPDTTTADPESMLPHFKDTRFWLSGQVNFIFQTHPDFHAAYSGQNSLSPHYEKATSRVMTLYTGVRLNNSTEILVDIEEAGGAALSTGLGLAGAPDLDIVRNPELSKAPYLARGMMHKVFALSSDKIENTR